MGLDTTNPGNILVQNYGLNPAVNFNFMLRVEALYDLPCKSVRVFQRENEYEVIQEGGLNDYVHMRRKPISKPFTFQVERYVGTDILDPLAIGTELVLPVILYINKDLVYRNFIPVRCYVFTGCTVTAKEYGELNAEKSGLLVETTTIAYREVFCLQNVASSFLTVDSWKFDGQKKEGNGVRNAKSYGQENTKSNMEQKAKKWDFSEESFKGTNQSAKNNTELRKNEMEIKSKEWDFKEGDFRGKNQSAKNNSELRKKSMEEKAKEWEFPKTGFQGKNRSAKNNSELRKKSMEEKAKEWEFPEAGFQGKNQNAKNNSELRKSSMEKKAVKWPPKASAVDIATFLTKGTENK